MIPIISQIVRDKIQDGTALRMLMIAQTLITNMMLEKVTHRSRRDGRRALKVAKTLQPFFQHLLIFIADGRRGYRRNTLNFFTNRQNREIAE